MTSGIVIRDVNNADDLEGAFALREQVFLREQGRDRYTETDDYDKAAHHIVALLDGEVVGTLRLYELHPGDRALKVGRVAVRSDLRGHGIGTKLMLRAHEWADGNYDSVYLHAQISVVGFYEKLGYVTVGEVFDEAGTPHITMRLVSP